MKKLLLLLLLSFCPFLAFSQIIRGRVMDRVTKKPVDHASVYINGTFLGTTTNVNGEFELDVSSQAKRAIQISAVGYRSTSLKPMTKEKYYEVVLERAIYEIEEVEVESESLIKERARCMRIFKNEFLGRSRNARDCIIMNEADITFNYHSNRDTLKAIARKPLIILNSALGYQVTYFLDKFEYDKVHKTTYFSGNINFNLDMAASVQSRKEYEARRKKTYIGSCKHFFSALWLNNLLREGFRVQKVDGIYPLDYDEYVIEDTQGKKYFAYHQNLEIAHYNYLSTVSFRDSRVYFGRDGFFEPEAILWYGYMSVARIADWLPYEYSP
jgi:hypothetical protein